MPLDKPALTIAVPTFNNFEQLKNCLFTLIKYVEFPFKIVIINNGDKLDINGNSFEKSLRQFVHYPALEIITPGENLGWQRSINKVFLEHCDTPFFCMMNDDLIFIPYHRTFIRQMMNYFRFDEVGAVGPSTNYVMGAQNINYHQFLLFSTGLLIGFFMLVRSKAFSEVGGLDEGLIGGDDLDLSMNLRKQGYTLLVDRSAYVHHIGSQTGARVAGKYWNSTEYIDISNNTLIKKHGVRMWYETIKPKIDVFKPATHMTDKEGDIIRGWINGLETGLDVGCGANKTVEGSIGIDQTAPGLPGLAGGRKDTPCAADIIGDASDLPFDEDSQDYLVARHLFEHVIDPLKVLEEWYRVLRPEGVLAIACPDQDVCSTMTVDFSHLHAYNPDSLSLMLKRCGFKIDKIELIRPGYSFLIKAHKPEKGIQRLMKEAYA